VAHVVILITLHSTGFAISVGKELVIKPVIDVRILKYKEVDLDELSQFTLAFYQGREEFRNETYDSERIRKMLEKLDEKRSRFVVARESDKLVGWMEIYDYTPSMNYIYPEHPIVLSNPNEDAIASRLIREAINYTQKIGKNRLEIFFDNLTEKNRSKIELYRRWYESSGMHQAGEWVHMTAHLDELDFPEIDFPDFIRIGKVRDVPNDELYTSYYQTFITSGNDRFLDQTDAERRENFDDFFDRTKAQDEDASILLFYDDKVIGFSQVILLCEKGFYNGIGIHPDYRKQGLGTKMLQLSMKRAEMNGMSEITLEVDVTNAAAINLYKRVGFHVDSGNVSFLWHRV